MSPDLIFLKLGGSLITDKYTPSTPLPERIAQLASELAAFMAANPDIRLLLGHGSGSFGHAAASKHGTRQGVRTPEQWAGFAEVWRQATALNRIVIEALLDAGLPAVSFSAMSSAIVSDVSILDWNLDPIKAGLESGLLPVVYGDVAFDQVRGGTILSTEDIFGYLARQLKPNRILLAGIEPGVWADYPDCTRIIPEITPQNAGEFFPAISGSAATDVTGGMGSKVRQMLKLVEDVQGLEVFIFSPLKSGTLLKSLETSTGTRIVDK
jgi:isopentenyl phosphate kinase